MHRRANDKKLRKLMHSQKRTTLCSKPYVAIDSYRADTALNMCGLVVGHNKEDEDTWGYIAIDDSAAVTEGLRMSRRMFQVGVLAACGLGSKTIAPKLSITSDTVHTHLQRTFKRTPVRNRMGLTRLFLHEEAFAISKNCKPFGLNDQEVATLNERSYGETSKEAAEGLGIYPSTAKTYLRNTAHKIGGASTATRILGAFASGELELEAPSLYFAKGRRKKIHGKRPTKRQAPCSNLNLTIVTKRRHNINKRRIEHRPGSHIANRPRRLSPSYCSVAKTMIRC